MTPTRLTSRAGDSACRSAPFLSSSPFAIQPPYEPTESTGMPVARTMNQRNPRPGQTLPQPRQYQRQYDQYEQYEQYEEREEREDRQRYRPRPRRRWPRHLVPRWAKWTAALVLAGLFFRRAVAWAVLAALSAALHVIGLNAHFPHVTFGWPWQSISAGTTTNVMVGPLVLQKIE